MDPTAKPARPITYMDSIHQFADIRCSSVIKNQYIMATPLNIWVLLKLIFQNLP